MKERRQTERVNINLPVFFVDEGHGNLETKTINIASNGLYCKLGKHIELYTRVFCTLVHPGGTNFDEAISIEGVVVRCDPPEEDPRVDEYNIAVFFDSITGADEEKLAKWLEYSV